MANQFEAQRFRYKSIAVGLSDSSFNNLAMGTTQYMVMGELQPGIGTNLQPTYSLLVDQIGVAIKSPFFSNISSVRASGGYPLYVEGDIYCTGSIITEGGLNINGQAPNNNVDGNYWKRFLGIGSSIPDINTIYYNDRVLIGSEYNSRVTGHHLTIAKEVPQNIENAQLAIWNNKEAYAYHGILGASANSPYIIATNEGTPLEIHGGRTSAFFSNIYRNQFGATVDNPIYSSSNAPAFCIDTLRNVGINTNLSPQMQIKRRVYQNTTGKVSYSNIVIRPSVYVNGVLYASNLVIYDEETESNQSLDSIYARQIGASFDASKIFPGSFAVGDYTFPRDVFVSSNLTTSNVTSRLGQFSNITSSNITARTALFSDQVSLQKDIYVRQNMFLTGGIYVDNGLDSNGNVQYSPIVFSACNVSTSNLTPYSGGFVTSGQVGIGVNLTDGSGVNHQLVVENALVDRMELELRDNNHSGFLGHFQWSDRVADGSFVITTSPIDTSNIGGCNIDIHQNIYMMPGAFADNTTTFQSACNIPLLALLDTSQVVVNGFESYEDALLTVNGNLAIKGTIMFVDEASNTTFNIARWKETIDAQSNIGVSYNITGKTTYAAINTTPDSNYGLKVAGRVNFTNGVSDNNGNLTGGDLWLNAADNVTLNLANANPEAPVRLYTRANVGLGVQSPTNVLELKSYNNVNETNIVIYRTDNTSKSSIEFRSTASNLINANYLIQACDGVLPTLEIRHKAHMGSSNMAMAVSYNQSKGKYQTTFNTSSTILSSNIASNDPSVLINGDLNVLGNINITGQYQVSGSVVINSNLMPGNVEQILPNDNVQIYSENLFLNQNDAIIINGISASNTRLHVYNNLINKSLARFEDSEFVASLEIVARKAGQSYKIEVNENGFQVINNTANGSRQGTCITFGKQKFGYKADSESEIQLISNQETPMAGFGTDVPRAILNPASLNSFEPILKCTRISSENNIDVGAYFDIEKYITGTKNSYLWRFNGPNGAISDSLTLEYMQTSNYVSEDYLINETKQKLFSMSWSSNGNVGIGSSNPSARLSIYNTNPITTLHLTGSISNTHVVLDSSNVANTPYRFKLNGQNSLVIEPFNTSSGAGSNSIVVSSNGSIGIRTSNMVADFNVNGTSKFTNNITCDQTITAGGINNVSDERLKRDIVRIENPLTKIDQLLGCTFTWRGSEEKSMGLIAQNVAQVVPEVTTQNSDGVYSVGYGNLVGLLVEGIKELKQQMHVMQQRIDYLEDVVGV